MPSNYVSKKQLVLDFRNLEINKCVVILFWPEVVFIVAALTLLCAGVWLSRGAAALGTERRPNACC